MTNESKENEKLMKQIPLLGIENDQSQANNKVSMAAFYKRIMAMS